MKVKSQFSDIFSDLKDHRINRTKLESPENIMFISLTTVISGAETRKEIEEFGNEKLDLLTKYLDLPNGVPSYDTFNSFFSTMDPDNFEALFRKWGSTLQRETKGDVVSIDGKSIRGPKGNNLHWILDVAFSEDRGRKQNKNAVINFSLINKITLQMLRKENSKKIGVKSRRLKSTWSTSYLEMVLRLI